MVGVRFPVELRFFSAPKCPNQLWSPPVSYRQSTGGKATEAWRWPLTKVKNGRIIPSRPNTSSSSCVMPFVPCLLHGNITAFAISIVRVWKYNGKSNDQKDDWGEDLTDPTFQMFHVRFWGKQPWRSYYLVGYVHSAYCFLLAWLRPRLWRWRQYVVSKRWQTKTLHCVPS
jgi:hypothetical protein